VAENPSPKDKTSIREQGRKAAILAAARQLFGERGFHAVGMNDIGAAAGISGPGIYRHFAGKEELLDATLRDASEQLWAHIGIGIGEGSQLDAFVRAHVRFAIANSDLISLWYQESQNLPPEGQIEQRRSQRRYIERWVDELLVRRPELDDVAARLMVRAAIGLIHSLRHSDQLLDPNTTENMLTAMAMASLDAWPPAPSSTKTQ
jgi:AcrR family transcriptional regulator